MAERYCGRVRIKLKLDPHRHEFYGEVIWPLRAPGRFGQAEVSQLSTSDRPDLSGAARIDWAAYKAVRALAPRHVELAFWAEGHPITRQRG